MSRLVVYLDVDADPILEDPEDVAVVIISDAYCGNPVKLVSAEWEAKS